MTPFIVAELSANHLGSLSRALQIVDAAADAGADAIKVQTWTADTMCLDTNFVLDHGPWKGQRLVDLYREAWLPWEWHKPIFDHARKRGLIPFSAAFDRESVDFLERLGVDRHKVASFELTDIPLIRYMASKGKPMILSTGMASHEEVMRAWVEASTNKNRVTMLKCVSAYPADASECNLAAICGGSDWGLSDHTQGSAVAVAATALGACMIEKHLTLSRADGGPDAGFSMEPAEFAQMVKDCRTAAAAIGEDTWGPTASESTELRRSLYISQDTAKGDKLVLYRNVRTARPAKGLPPSTDISSAYASRALRAGEPLTQDCIA